MNRTRTTQALGPLGTMTHTSNTVATSGPWTHRMTQVDSTMSDVVTPNFKKRIARGEVINNPCSNLKSSIYRSGGGSYNATRNSNPSLYSRVSGTGSLTAAYRAALSGPSLLTVTLPVNDLAQSAQSKALASMDKAPYAIAEDIATIREAYKFAMRPWQSIEDLAVHYARARKSLRYVAKHGSTLRKAPRSLASLWLEYRFAFMPMVRSVVNVMESLADPSGRKYDTVHTAHGFAELEKSDSGTVVLSNFSFKRGVKTKKSVRAVVQYRVQPPLREWQYKYGLRFKDVPELMWDLFPLSFMYDRVLNIGDAVRGLTNFSDPSIDILGGTVSVTTETSQDISMFKQTASGWTVTIVPDTDFFFTEEYVRAVWQPSVLNVVPPVLPGGLVKDLTSMADLGALILQRLK